MWPLKRSLWPSILGTLLGKLDRATKQGLPSSERRKRRWTTGLENQVNSPDTVCFGKIRAGWAGSQTGTRQERVTQAARDPEGDREKGFHPKSKSR